MSNYMLERVFTLMLRNDDGTYKIFYPKTVAEQVLATDITLKEHCTDFLSHIWDTERRLMNNTNKPNGYALLDSEGYLEKDQIRKELLAINKEYTDITALLGESRCQPGKLVIVLDATDDPGVDEGWAIYRRTKEPDYWDLNRGWQRVSEQESLEIDMTWDHVKDHPTSRPADIDRMVATTHVHTSSETLDKLGLSQVDGVHDHEYFSYNGARLGEAANIVSIHVGATERVYPKPLRGGDFWYKPSIGQSWWFDPAVEEAGLTCYEKYRDQTSMTISPLLRTNKTTVMRRMFYRCENLEVVNQYDTRNVYDFTGMFYECHNVRELPPFYSHKGRTFDSMFYGCSKLVVGPELDLRSATTTAGMFSGCEKLKYIQSMKNTGMIADMREMFNGCRSLERLPELDCSGISTDEGLLKTFNECFSLSEISFKPGTLKCSISLENTAIDLDVIRNIFESLPVVNNKVINLIGTPGISKLTSAEREVATNKGWVVLPAL